MDVIGERLSEVRKDHGDTQADLAARLGVSLPTVCAWEQEKSAPGHEMLVNICRTYRVSADFLLGLSDVDPAYVQRKRLAQFTPQELDVLQEFEQYLLWRRGRKKKTGE